MHLLWGMMNTLQLISYLLQFNLIVPGNAFMFFKTIHDFISMRS